MSVVAEANSSNNARGDRARRRRWQPARDAAWELLDGCVVPGARVAVVGAGNGHDLPLRRLAARAAALDLIDLDPAALQRARAAVRRRRRRVAIREQDVTAGAADAIVAAAVAGAAAAPAVPAVPAARTPATPIGAGGYDVVVADLVLTQLLYPALRRTALDGRRIDAVLLRDGQPLVDAVVARLHASVAEGGSVVILHDLLGWWDGHPQPFVIADVLRAAREDGPGAALRLARTGDVPYGCDPWLATRRAGADVSRTALWRWPFAPSADYLVCGLVTARGRRLP